jgi:hypothetical protein
VPTLPNLWLNVDPPPSVPLPKEPPSAVTVCGALPVFVQVTVVPALMVSVAGVKPKSTIVAATCAVVAVGEGRGVALGRGVVVGRGVAAGFAVGAGVGFGVAAGWEVAVGRALADGGTLDPPPVVGPALEEPPPPREYAS